MKVLEFGRYALCSCVVPAFLAGCGASPRSDVFLAGSAADYHVGKSGVAADIKESQRLAFVSNNTDVYILSLPDLKFKARLSGFGDPEGMCVDSSGNVWVANANAQTMILLSHDGTYLRTLDDHGATPVSCAIDPTTGNLAVLNVGNYGRVTGPPGEILIFPAASGTPTEQTIPNFYRYGFGGYDDKGNLFAVGKSYGGTPILGVIPKGSNTGSDIAITNGKINDPGFVQWYAPKNVLAVDDQECNGGSCLYQLSISGSAAKIVKSTTFLYGKYKEPKCDFVQGEIATYANHYFVAGCSGVDRWPYPAGGAPINRNGYFISTYAVVISAK